MAEICRASKEKWAGGSSGGGIETNDSFIIYIGNYSNIGDYSIPSTIPSWNPIFYGIPINSPIVGSFLGVALAFLVNHIAHIIKNRVDKNYYEDVIEKETEQCITILNETLEKRTILPLPTDRWTSVINTGALRLFNVNSIDKLSRFYYEVQKYNNRWLLCAELDEPKKLLKKLQEIQKEGWPLKHSPRTSK